MNENGRSRPLICIAYERVGDALRGVPVNIKAKFPFAEMVYVGTRRAVSA